MLKSFLGAFLILFCALTSTFANQTYSSNRENLSLRIHQNRTSIFSSREDFEAFVSLLENVPIHEFLLPAGLVREQRVQNLKIEFAERKNSNSERLCGNISVDLRNGDRIWFKGLFFKTSFDLKALIIDMIANQYLLESPRLLSDRFQGFFKLHEFDLNLREEIQSAGQPALADRIFDVVDESIVGTGSELDEQPDLGRAGPRLFSGGYFWIRTRDEPHYLFNPKFFGGEIDIPAKPLLYRLGCQLGCYYVQRDLWISRTFLYFRRFFLRYQQLLAEARFAGFKEAGRLRDENRVYFEAASVDLLDQDQISCLIELKSKASR